MSVEEKLKLGIICEIKTTQGEEHLVISFENGYILAYKICTVDHQYRYTPIG